MRKTIAKRLTSAKTLIPHYYLTIECNIDALLEARARLNARSPKGDGAYKLSVNDFIIKASAMALMVRSRRRKSSSSVTSGAA